jgi:hypothetical protein
MFERSIADRMGALAGESAFQVLAAANRLEAQGRNVIHFEIGEPDFPTAPHVIEAAKKALDAGQTAYCNSQGLVSLRETIAEYTRAYKSVTSKKEQIVVAPGGKPIICAISPGGGRRRGPGWRRLRKRRGRLSAALLRDLDAANLRGAGTDPGRAEENRRIVDARRDVCRRGSPVMGVFP